MDSDKRRELKNRMKYRNLLNELQNRTRIDVFTKPRIMEHQFQRVQFNIIKSDLPKRKIA